MSTERPPSTVPWVFLTGTPRSGTTFVAEILRSARGAAYVHEPFNPSCSVEGLTARYPYLDPEGQGVDAERYADIVARIRALSPLRFKTQVWPGDPVYLRVAKRIVGGRGAVYYRAARRSGIRSVGILKDPTAFFLAPFLERRGGMRTVVVVRHPASWTSSFLRTGWSPELELFRTQEPLLERLPSDDLRLLESSLDRVEEVAVFWRVAYGFLFRECPRAIVLRHEDLSADAPTAFRQAFERLDLPWDRVVDRRIARLTSNANADGRTGRLSDLRRNSASIFETRVGQLSAGQRSTVWDITSPVAHRMYEPVDHVPPHSVPNGRSRSEEPQR